MLSKLDVSLARMERVVTTVKVEGRKELVHLYQEKGRSGRN